MAKRAKTYEPKTHLKEQVEFTDLVSLSLRTRADFDKPAPKKKAKKK